MSIVPPPESFTRTSMTLPTKLLEAIEELRLKENEKRDKPARFSRDAFLQVGLEWFVRELAAEAKRGKGK